MRLGLNSGDVVVGKIGGDLRMDYTAQGHAGGLAGRMQQIAAPLSRAIATVRSPIPDPGNWTASHAAFRQRPRPPTTRPNPSIRRRFGSAEDPSPACVRLRKGSAIC